MHCGRQYKKEQNEWSDRKNGINDQMNEYIKQER